MFEELTYDLLQSLNYLQESKNIIDLIEVQRLLQTIEDKALDIVIEYVEVE